MGDQALVPFAEADGDTEFQDRSLRRVQEVPGGWSVTDSEGWSLFVPEAPGVEPKVGSAMRTYGRGIGSTVRGIFIDGVVARYETADQMVSRRRDEQYGVDAADWLAKWDRGEIVWTVVCGGFSPGYEQALQIAAFEALRFMLDAKSTDEPPFDVMEPRIGALNLSGAQWGAACGLARRVYRYGPAETVESFPSDRHIMVSRDFPQAPEAPEAR